MGAKKKKKRKPFRRARRKPKGTGAFVLKADAVLKSNGIPMVVPQGTVIYTNPANIKLMDIEV